ncbi:MAG: DUF1835 domain-containing protein [Acetobacteraceae bacterium]|nr:DUF1835 domain-containing protein [Acetobacteraceae bacterium]
MAAPPVPATPAFRLNLEQQRNRARDLLRAVQAGDADALARFHAHQPADRRPTLTAAQHVIARELRLPSWPRLKAHVAAMEAARATFAGAAPDADRRTLHIRCGSDIANRLVEAGFVGDFLEYSDPICQGPVTDAPDWLDQRARFIVGSVGNPLGLTVEAVRANLATAEERLDAAPAYERIVLWFEHDSYDQLLLARALARFAAAQPRHLDLVCVDAFPGGQRFIGLGQLPPEALRLLWARRQPVTPVQLDLGVAVWAALQAPDPTALAEIARSGTPALPVAAPALLRHLRELPDTRDGLGLTERLALTILVRQETTIGRVFAALMTRDEPLPWLGDLMLLAIVETMARAAEPALVVDPEDAALPWPQRRLHLTGAARAVLAGQRDYLSLGPLERWVGGVQIRPGTPHWRWDDAAGMPVRVG